MNKGIALIDLLLGVTISMIVLGGMCAIMALVIADNSFLLQWSSSTHTVDTALGMIGTDARGTVYLKPAEDLINAGDAHYVGISSIPNASAPAACQRGGLNSTIRISYVDRLLPAGKTDATWSESSIAITPLLVDATPPPPGSPSLLFSGASYPKTIIVVDAYNFFARRYLVTRVRYKLGTHRNPETGLIDLGTYYYAQVSLAMPPYLNGTNSVNGGVTMVAGSFVFGAHTSIFCLSAANGSLIQIDEQNPGTPTTLVPNPDGDYTIQPLVAGNAAFSIKYFNTGAAADVPVVPASFLPDMMGPNYNCIDSLFLTLTLSPTPTAAAKFTQGQIPQGETTISRSQGAFLTNMYLGRPDTCP